LEYLNETVIIGAIGGLIYNLLQLIQLANTPRESRPDFKDIFYWLPYPIMIFLAGFLTYVYDTPQSPLSKLLALHIGISSPLILKQMMQILPFKPGSITLKDENQ